MTKFNLGDVVRIVSNNEIGAVIRSFDNENGNTYEVLVNGERLLLDESQLEVFVESKTHFSNKEELDCYLTSVSILNPSKDIYSLNSAKISFIPYQYRPVLKILKSDEPRILIADDVGVGKTIEAGLIIKELSARQSMNSILIFCPKPLIAEEKWLREMKIKFNEKFQHLDKKALKNAIKECDYEGEWIPEYSRCIIPYSILTDELLTGIDEKGKKSIGLYDLRPAPKFDLVIVDEAHHIRNQNTQAYSVIEYFCRNAEAVVFLTATPIQLGNRDLFVLLNLLRPDYILDEDTFEVMAEPNPHFNLAINYIRLEKENWKEASIQQLEEAKSKAWCKQTGIDISITNIIRRIENTSSSVVDRMEIISEIEKLHTFGNIINRTRKRDIGKFTVRKPITVRNDFTESQLSLYQDLIELQTQIFLLNYPKNIIKFLMSTLYRQSASCIFGLIPFLNDILTRHLDFESFFDTDEFDKDEFDPEELKTELKKQIAIITQKAAVMDKTDNKLERFKKIISEKQELENNKIIVFSSFKHTLNYLYSKLQESGFRVGLLTGDVKDEERLIVRNRFELDKKDKDAIDVILFSEIGCEGLDYQFCDCLINYDLPWNPMRIEQRIGRIDRNGQKSESILIYNMITEGTIDAEIYDRCLSRIGIFNYSVGFGEEILGQIQKEIENIAVSYKLSEKEKSELLHQLADNEIRLIKENEVMEENQYNFLSLKMPYDEDKRNIENFTNYWLSPEKINILVRIFLKRKYDIAISRIKNSNTYELKFNEEKKNLILKDYYSQKNDLMSSDRTWTNFVKTASLSYIFSTDPQENIGEDICLITPTHPLVQMACSYFVSLGNKYVTLSCKTELPFNSNEIEFSLYEWKYEGDQHYSQIKIISNYPQYEKEIERMIRDGEVLNTLQTIDSKHFEDIHTLLWNKERARYTEKEEDVINRHIESLKVSYQKRLNKVNNQISTATNQNILRMKKKEFDNIQNECEYRIKKLEEQKTKIDIFSKYLCSGVIKVVR